MGKAYLMRMENTSFKVIIFRGLVHESSANGFEVLREGVMRGLEAGNVVLNL